MNALFNFMQIEAEIVKRLEFVTQNDVQNGTQSIPAWCKKVGTLQYVNFIQEAKQVTPALYVVYQGKTVAAQGTRSMDAHRWAVVLAIKHAADQKSTDYLNNIAGLYLAQVQAAFKGFTPAGAVEMLKEVTPPAPYYNSGFAYFPLMFEAKVLQSSKFGSGIAKPSDTNRDVLTDRVNDYS